jgi:hypothetical protein
MAHLTMVYDADGGLAGELRYVVGHLLGRTECSLCDITHGPVRRKAEFDRLVADLEADGWTVRVVHRNEQMPAEAASSDGELPCVLRADAAAGPWEVAVDAGALRACRGDVAALAAAIAAA